MYINGAFCWQSIFFSSPCFLCWCYESVSMEREKRKIITTKLQTFYRMIFLANLRSTCTWALLFLLGNDYMKWYEIRDVQNKLFYFFISENTLEILINSMTEFASQATKKHSNIYTFFFILPNFNHYAINFGFDGNFSTKKKKSWNNTSKMYTPWTWQGLATMRIFKSENSV